MGGLATSLVAMVVAVVVLVVVADSKSRIGVNWGTIASQPIPPKVVVGMLKDNGIKKVKLFEVDENILKALANTSIEVIVGIPNDQLPRFQSVDEGEKWVKKSITQHVDQGVAIKYVAVGNEPFLKSYNDSYTNITLPAMKAIKASLDAAGHSGVKVTVPMNADVYEGTTNAPSSGDFRKEVKPQMLKIIDFLNATSSVLMVNIYPYISLYQDPNFPAAFAFFDGIKEVGVTDGDKAYTNVFDANYDTLVWALRKNGHPELPVAVGEVGWPTDGEAHANATNAERFYGGLMRKLAAGEGTPMRPGAMRVYLFGLVDENMKSIAPGPFERHWGIFTYDGKPKFKLDITSEGNKGLVGAKGLDYMEPQWCVLDWDAMDLGSLDNETKWACSRADCTKLLEGASCGHLDEKAAASYAFNMNYQMNNQEPDDCDFNGLGRVTSENASSPSCLFPVEIRVEPLGRSNSNSFSMGLSLNSFRMGLSLASVLSFLTVF